MKNCLKLWLVMGILVTLLTSCCTHTHKTKKPSCIYTAPTIDKVDMYKLANENMLSFVPRAVTVDERHQVGIAEQLNIHNFYLVRDIDLKVINQFILQKFKENLPGDNTANCTVFSIKPGVYTFGDIKVSIAKKLTWRLVREIPRQCYIAPENQYQYRNRYWQFEVPEGKVYS